MWHQGVDAASVCVKLFNNIATKQLLFACRHHVRGQKKFSASRALHDSDINVLSSDGLFKPESDTTKATSLSNAHSEDKQVALLLGYCGQNYHGMQSFTRKCFRKTVERELLTALAKAAVITEEESRRSFKIGFQAGASRTDKGVSACRQLVSFRTNLTKSTLHDLVEKTNSHLPPEVRIFACKEVTKNFVCWKFCDYRTYSYLLPTFAFAPIIELTKEDYRIQDSTIDEVNNILSLFKGTHTFYNFTSGLEPNEPSLNRVVNEFKCGKPFVRDGMEFAIVTVKGHSFVLHQIRKMIGLTIAIMRGLTSLHALSRAWLPARIHIPTAPGQGLFLEDLHYTGYNKNFAVPNELEPLSWDEHTDAINNFKEAIFSTVVSTEKKDKSMLKWLALLSYHHYDPFDAAQDHVNRWMMSHLALTNSKNNEREILRRGEIRLANDSEISNLRHTLLNGEKKAEHNPSNEPTIMEVRKKPIVAKRPKDTPIIILLGYSGQGFHGMQRSKDVRTVEGLLLQALEKAGILSANDALHASIIRFHRASRTDKGVSACRQLVSFRTDLKNMKFSDIVEKTNHYLPPEVRVFGCKKVAQSFNCWKMCDSRSYSYVTPSFAFTPLEELTMENYRITASTIDQVNAVMSKFVGAHSFYNFTSKWEPDNPLCQRIVTEFKCGEKFVNDGIEFLTISIKGNSFMLHQIRKMIGLTIAIVRGLASVDIITKAWLPSRIHLPIAPGLGLLLDDLHYESYNKLFAGGNNQYSLTWDEHLDTITKFKEEVIMSTIVNAERKDKVMLKWLALLLYHHYEPIDAAQDYVSKWMMSRLALMNSKNNEKQIVKRGKIHLANDREIINEQLDEEKKPVAAVRPEDITIAILLGYSGQGFHGMQRTRGVRTVEGQLLQALEKAGILSANDSMHPGNIHFHRASRTDTGVSACRQLVSFRTDLKNMNFSDIVEKTNHYLPPEVRVFGCKKVAQDFNCWKMCDSRTYSYVTPSFAFTPVEKFTVEDYRISASTIDQVNVIMSKFVGAHSFYNFTSKWEPDDQLCERIVTEFKCKEMFVNDGIEFFTISIKGNSFLLHQIRKMIGLTIAIVRGVTSVDIITKAWLPSRIHLPIAPGLGLLLEDLHYVNYNRLFAGGDNQNSLTWDEHLHTITKFKEEVIIPAIVNTECKDKVMLNWLGSQLSRHQLRTTLV